MNLYRVGLVLLTFIVSVVVGSIVKTSISVEDVLLLTIALLLCTKDSRP